MRVISANRFDISFYIGQGDFGDKMGVSVSVNEGL
jgi:hypothetical protein